jgi:PAS domain S-box-containing protein
MKHNPEMRSDSGSRRGADPSPVLRHPIPDIDGHFVRFYENDQVLIQSVSTFLGAGLGAGESALMIGTESHRSAVEEKLAAHGIDLAAVKGRGQFLALDARETLRKFMRDGAPDEDLFMKTIGELIAKTASKRPGLRAFGEMVALLWADNAHEAAVKLEELWNKLGKTIAFSLYCAYPINGFKNSTQGKLFARICHEHGAVMPGESFAETGSAEDRGRAIALLQQKAASLETEVSERRRIEDALRESEIRFRTLADSAPVMMWMTDNHGATLYVNRPWLEFTGRALAEELAQDYASGIQEEDRAKAVEAFEKAKATRSPFRVEYRYRRFDGAHRWMLDTGAPRFAADGVFLGFIGTCIDISGLKDTEEQLRQAQKMEAMGRLAGGIAHDFNNLLTAINGYSEMALGMVQEDTNLSDYLGEIKRSGERAASLTQQLLAYSRKQILAPIVFDLNETVKDMDRMLRRLIGEHIRMESALEPDLGLVRADPGQIQQIILNLVLNARDAMPEGGRLDFETSNVILDKNQGTSARKPHVMLAVRDTGSGMTPDVKSRIFEPFFTTKDLGKGTGLGLSSVYGIIKQSGGIVDVESEVGRGSVFRIYLPIVEAAKDPGATSPALPARGGKGMETILLVEDEETVRKFILRTLASQGYSVLEAKDGAAATRIAEKHKNIDLLLTDVVMPNVNGALLAKRIKAMHPDIRILFMSGYTDNIFLPGGVIDPGSKFLQKPFGQADLQLKIKELLEQAKSSQNA